MTEEIERLLERLRNEGEKTVAFFSEIDSQDWARQVYTDGASWTVREVLAHFVEAEESVTRLIRHVVGGGAGAPEDFDLDAYNARKVSELDGLSPEELLEQFKMYRDRTAEMLSGFQPADLEKRGRHPFLGVAPVADMLKLMYRHNQLHQRDLRRFLK